MTRRNFIKKATIAGTAIHGGFLGALGSAMSNADDPVFDASNFSEAIILNKQGRKVFVLKPTELDEILANPGIGWETMEHPAKQDKNLPSWIPSTVWYNRWGWDKFEPRQGQIDTDFINGILKEAHDSGQKLAFRVMTMYPGAKMYPDWLKEIGGKINYVKVFIDGPNHEGVPVIDFDDSVVLEAHIKFIEKLGVLYDGHPDVNHIDIGSVGWWGEWHLAGSDGVMPSIESMRKIVDAYINAFRKTPLVIPIGSSKYKLLQYATEQGTGWRADCFGDMDPSRNLRGYYTQALRADTALGAWKRGLVAWESCWYMKTWVTNGWPLRFIFNYGLALHGSVFNNKSSALPEGEEVKAEIVRFLKRLGYRFVLKETVVPVNIKAGSKLEVSTKWQNTGSAPCYRPYRLAYRLAARNREEVFISSVDIKNWMPGDMELNPEEYLKDPVDLPLGEINEVKDSIDLPGDIKPGKYRLSIAIVGEESDKANSEKPVIRLGIKGRTEDGWYPLSEITITE